MATAGKNLSSFDAKTLPSGEGFRIALIASQWNADITDSLLEGAKSALRELGTRPDDVLEVRVPGSFELPTAALWVAEADMADAIVVIGSVIQGETRHFEFVCQAVAQGTKDVSIKTGVPVIFCVLTDDTLAQAQARSGGIHGNKGVEAAVAAVQMAHLRKDLQ